MRAVVDNAFVLDQVAPNAQLRALLPELESYWSKLPPANCPPCQLHKYADAAETLKLIRRRLGGLPLETKREMMRLIGATQLRFYWTDDAGEDQRLTVTNP